MLFETDRYNAFQITADGFNYKGSSYLFDEISHLFFSHVLTTQRLNFVKVGQPESAYLHIILSSRKKLKLSFDEFSFWMGFNFNKKKDIKNLVHLYAFLAKKTFANRLEHYLRQISENGYFVYDNCRFYPNNKIVFRKKEFPVKSSSFMKRCGYVGMRPKSGIVDKIIWEMSIINLPQFNTETDPDIIFHLLEKYLGLKWS